MPHNFGWIIPLPQFLSPLFPTPRFTQCRGVRSFLWPLPMPRTSLRNLLHPSWIPGTYIGHLPCKFPMCLWPSLADLGTFLVGIIATHVFPKGPSCFKKKSKPECPARHWEGTDAPRPANLRGCWLVPLFIPVCHCLVPAESEMGSWAWNLCFRMG